MAFLAPLFARLVSIPSNPRPMRIPAVRCRALVWAGDLVAAFDGLSAGDPASMDGLKKRLRAPVSVLVIGAVSASASVDEVLVEAR